MKRPNILYIHSHDTGRYVQPYGHAIETPRLQQFAEEGVLFRQNFCTNPTCSPSRSALLTGCYPHENGMTGLAHRGWFLKHYGQHIVHTLRRAGYTSVLTGVQHLASPDEQKPAWQIIGYDKQLDGVEYEQAAAYLGDSPKEPFFLSVGFVETHRNFPDIAEAPEDPRYCLPPAPLPDTPETRLDMAGYKACARILDYKMGVVFDALQRSGKADNTLVICTTDHGIAFPRMKCNLHDSGTGVMLIIRGPGGFAGGKVIDRMTSHLDVFPTVCDLLHIEPPAWLRGKSLLPLVSDNADSPNADALHEQLFFEVNFHAAYEPMRAVRTNRWKYIRRFGERTVPVLPNCDDGESKSLWLDNGWKDITVDKESLFDLVFDPNENNNLAGDPGKGAVIEDMRSRVRRWMEETNDPLLSGEIRAPVSARVNDSDGISPQESLRSADL